MLRGDLPHDNDDTDHDDHDQRDDDYDGLLVPLRGVRGVHRRRVHAHLGRHRPLLYPGTWRKVLRRTVRRYQYERIKLRDLWPYMLWWPFLMHWGRMLRDRGSNVRLWVRLVLCTSPMRVRPGHVESPQ